MAEEDTETPLLTLVGDHGSVTCNLQGMPVLYRPATDEYGRTDREYLDIVRFDVAGYYTRYPHHRGRQAVPIDIIHMGFWTTGYEYVEPCSVEYKQDKAKALGVQDVMEKILGKPE